MGNRKQPFGCKMEFGQIVPEPMEAVLVVELFRRYNTGASFNELVDWLRDQGVPYDGDKPWNKNMVARILDDSRYTGEKGYPQLLPAEYLAQARERRAGKQNTTPKTEAQKRLRQLAGQTATEKLEREVMFLLNRVIQDPAYIRQPQRETKADRVSSLERTLQRVLDQQPIDEDHASALIYQLAAAQYDAIDCNEYETIRLQRIFTKHEVQNTLDPDLLRAAISKIDLQRGGRITLYMKNGQTIRRSEAI